MELKLTCTTASTQGSTHRTWQLIGLASVSKSQDISVISTTLSQKLVTYVMYVICIVCPSVKGSGRQNAEKLPGRSRLRKKSVQKCSCVI